MNDQALVDAYRETGSCWKAGKLVGLSGQTAWEKLKRLGAMTPVNLWTEADGQRLRAEYLLYRNAGRLDVLAMEMGRTKAYLCKQAKRLNLTDPRHARPYASTWKHMPEAVAEGWLEKFRSSRLGMGAFCRKNGIDDLGFATTMRRFFPAEYEALVESKAPKSSLYRLGRAFEYRTRDALKALGFFVLRSPGSKSPIDLVAIRSGEVLFVQCKRHGQLGCSEWNELFKLARACGAIPVLASVAAAGRGLDMFSLTGMKDGSKRPQPMAPLRLDVLE